MFAAVSAQSARQVPKLAGAATTALALIILFAMTSMALANPSRWKSEGWKTDFDQTTINLKEILSGGPPKDGIPSIDRPVFTTVAKSDNLKDNEPVVGLSVDGDARAYPIRVLIWHEIVNDTVGGRPVTVTFCPLCNSAIVFDRKVAGDTLEFGTTGKLRNSDLVMYDRKTESWWQQFTGDAIVGSMVGQSLKMIPARLESFAEFKARHPQGKVLIPNNPEMRAYGRNPYVGYDSAPKPFLYNGAMPEGINPMARVVAVRRNGKAAAVAMDLLSREKRLTVGDVTLSWRAGQASAIDKRNIADGRDVGTVTATATGGDGKPADVPYDVTFAFVFHAFHPDEKIRTE